MKLGIMQPYFFPYLGYFDLIRRTDAWVVFDTPQYMRHGWVNRNRILHPTNGWQYVVVPLRKHSRNIAIRDVLIAGNGAWKQRVYGQLQHYKKRARYFRETMDVLQRCLECDTDSLSELNVHCLACLCQYLGIPFHYRVFSELQLELTDIEGPGDWALQICKALGADEYWNPPGGAGLFDHQKYAEAGVRLQIQDYTPMLYDTRDYPYQPALSILDVLMWCRPAEIVAHLESAGTCEARNPDTTNPSETAAMR